MKGKATTGLFILCWVGLFTPPLHGSFEAEEPEESLPSLPARHSVCSDLFQQLGAKYQNALVALADQRLDEAISIIRQENFSLDQKVVLWRLLTRVNSDRARTALPDFRFEGEALESVLAEIVAFNPEFILESFPRLAHTVEDRYRIAKLLAERIPLGAHMAKLQIESEEHRTSLAIISISHAPKDFIKHADQFAILTPDRQALVIAALAAKGKFESGNGIWDYARVQAEASPEARREVARALAPHDKLRPFEMSPTRQWVKDLTPSEVQEIAGIWLAGQINESGWGTIRAEGFFDRAEAFYPHRIEILVNALNYVTRTRLRQHQERDEFIFNFFDRRINSLLTAAPQIRKILFQRDALQVIADANHVESLDQLNLVEEGDTLDLFRALRNFAQENPELFPESKIGIFWSEVRNRDVVLTLLREFFSQYEGDFSKAPSSSLELLAMVTGLPYSGMSANRDLRKNPTELYELALAIQDKMAKPAFSYVPVDPEVFSKRREFLELLRLLRDLHEQKGDGTKGWKATLESLGLTQSNGIREDNLDTLRQQARTLLVQSIRDRLSAQNIDFTYEDFVRLEQEWGDLEPIWTLLSRFQANSGWMGEVPLLIEVFKASLNHEFELKKFYGGFDLLDDVVNTRNQLAGLSANQLEAWKKPRAIASLPGAIDNADTDYEAKLALRQKQIGEVLIRGVVPTALAMGIPPAANESSREKVFVETKLNPALAELLKQEPHAIVDRLVNEFREDEVLQGQVPELMALIISEMKPSRSFSELKALSRVLSSLSSFHLDSMAKEKEDFLSQLRELNRLLKWNEPATGTSEIIFTALNSDPKFLLTIGAAVNVTSCQNYQTGGQIKTLLGYVVDANIRAMVSYSLKQQDFETPAQFHQVARALAKGSQVVSRFDGNQKRATFEIRSGTSVAETVTTKPLGQGFLRRMLKYGKSTDFAQVPFTKFEKAYQQSHNHLSLMMEQQETLRRQIHEAFGVDPEAQHSIHVVASRNPGGVYSDFGGGSKTGDYEIP